MWWCSCMFTAALSVGCRRTKWNWQAADWATGGVSACLTLPQPQWRWAALRTCCSSPRVLALTVEISREAFDISPASVWNETWHWTLTHSALKPERFPTQWDRAGYLPVLVVQYFVLCVRGSFVCVSLIVCEPSSVSSVSNSLNLCTCWIWSICCILVFLLFFLLTLCTTILLPDLSKTSICKSNVFWTHKKWQNRDINFLIDSSQLFSLNNWLMV